MTEKDAARGTAVNCAGPPGVAEPPCTRGAFGGAGSGSSTAHGSGNVGGPDPWVVGSTPLPSGRITGGIWLIRPGRLSGS
jgi:hypothetical protein